MATVKLTNKTWRKPFGARWQIWDPNLSAYIVGPRVSGVSFAPEKTSISMDNILDGMAVEIEERTTAIRGRLSMNVMEPGSPHFHQLAFSDATRRQTLRASDTVTLGTESPFLYGVESEQVGHPYGLAQRAATHAGTTGNLPFGTIANVAGVAGGNDIPAGDYSIAVAPCFGTNQAVGGTEGSPVATALTNLDKTWTMGTFSAIDNSLAGGGAMGINDDMQLDVVAPATGPTPDFYALVVSDTGAGIVQFLLYIFETDGLAQVTDATNTTWADKVINVFVATSIGYYTEIIDTYDPTATPVATMTQVSALTPAEVVFNLETGYLKRIAGSATALSNAQYIHYYWWIKPSSVLTKYGDVGTSQDYRKFKLISVEGDDPSLAPDDWREEGLEFIFFRSNCSGLGGTLTFNDEDYPDGVPVDVPVLFDEDEGCICTVEGATPQLNNWVAAYL